MNVESFFKNNKHIYGLAINRRYSVPVCYYVKFTDLKKAKLWETLESEAFPIKELCRKNEINNLIAYKYEVDEKNVWWGHLRGKFDD